MFERVSFHRMVVPEGCLYVCKSCRNGWFDCFTSSKGYGSLIYQFGFKAKSFDEAEEIVSGNYSSGNVIWQNDDDFFRK